VWNSALIGVGAALGTRSQAVLSAVSVASAYALVAAAVGAVLFLALRRSRTLRTQQ
jgi:uncharacterized membrane protein YeaQ/YmgE (transglycosylase-associated protein family)